MKLKIKNEIDGESIVRSIIKELNLNFLLMDTGYEYDNEKYQLDNLEVRPFYLSRHSVKLSKIVIETFLYCNATVHDGKMKLLNIAFNMTVTAQPECAFLRVVIHPSDRKQRVDYGLAVFPMRFSIAIDAILKHYNYYKLALS